MTKSFSTAAALLLRDDGVIRLDDAIDDLMPALAALRGPTDDTAPITVRDLLGMSSGLVTDDPWADRHLDLTDDELDRSIQSGPVFARPPGDGFEYSNLGFAVLGRIVRNLTGASLQAVVSERILEPLGLHDTTWTAPDHHAPPFRRDGVSPESPPPGDGAIAPMGGLWSSVSDILRWACWLADAFPARDGNDDGPLRRSSRREMQQPLRFAGVRPIRDVQVPASYGLGLLVLHDPSHGIVIGHSGGLPGYGSNMRWTPGGGVALVALSNRTYAPMAELNARLHDHLASALDLEPIDHRPVRTDPEIIDLIGRLVSIMTSWSNGAAVTSDVLDGVFADNVGPDEPFADRFDVLRRAGPIRFHSPDRATGGGATLDGVTDDGRSVHVATTLAPTRPFRIQRIEITLDRPS